VNFLIREINVVDDILQQNTGEIIPHLYNFAATLQPKSLLEISLGVHVDTKTISDYARLYELGLSIDEQTKIATYKRSRKQIMEKRRSIWNKLFN
jgi:hypothetical protein